MNLFLTPAMNEMVEAVTALTKVIRVGHSSCHSINLTTSDTRRVTWVQAVEALASLGIHKANQALKGERNAIMAEIQEQADRTKDPAVILLAEFEHDFLGRPESMLLNHNVRLKVSKDTYWGDAPPKVLDEAQWEHYTVCRLPPCKHYPKTY